MRIFIAIALACVILSTGCGCPQRYAHDNAGRHWVESQCAGEKPKFVRWAASPSPTRTDNAEENL